MTIRFIGANPGLTILEGVAGLPWPDPVVETGEVHLELDLATGMTAVANDIQVDL